MGRIGAHVSVAGGMPAALTRAQELDCEAFQVFVRSPNRWSSKARPPEESDAFRAGNEEAALPVIAHAGYLINLASPKPDVRAKSHQGLLDELRRCEALGVSGLVMHPGAPQEDGREVGIDRVAAGLDAVLAELGPATVRVLLENTAGQGSTLGLTPAELQEIRVRCDAADRVGVCLDTCHAFAAGYDLRRSEEWARLLDEVDAGPGLGEVRAWHLNDSRFEAGERKDRHANIGAGEIGVEPFARLLDEARFAALPMILETPLGDDDQGHARDLATLRSLRGTASA